MAATDSNRTKRQTRPRRGIRHVEYDWGCITFGSREELVERGITCASPFPGEQGPWKTKVLTLDPAGRAIKICCSGKTRFEVYRDWSEEECTAYEIREKRRKELDEARDRVASWPTSPARFREDAADMVRRVLAVLDATMCDGWGGGWRYDDEALLSARMLADKVLEVVTTGRVFRDAVLREANTPSILAAEIQRLDAAKSDKDFRQFLDEVTMPPKMG